MLIRIDHIELVVRDLDATVAWFTELGFQEVRRTPHHRTSVELKLPDPDQTIWEIHEVAGDEVIGIDHVGFLVEDVHQAYQELSARGIVFQGPPHYVKQSGRLKADMRDPTGYRYHIVDPKRADPGSPVGG